MTKSVTRTRASRILARILGENGATAKRIRARIDKGVLSRLASGARGPTIETAVALRILTKGEIPERLWAQPRLVAERLAVRA